MSRNRVVRLGSPNNIKLDSYDLRICSDVMEKSSRFDSLAQRGERVYGAAFTPLAQDIWGIFYKAEPEMVDEAKIDPTCRKNRMIVKRVLEDGTTKETRAFTMLDEVSSALAAVESIEKLLDEIRNNERLNDFFENEQNVEEGEIARTLRKAVRESLKQGQEAAERLHTVLAGWGLEPADLRIVPPDNKRLEVAYRLIGNARLRRMAELVGRFRNLARTKRREKLQKRQDEIHSITLGEDLAKILPAELASLSHPVRKLDFYRRFVEKQLLIYELKENVLLGRGPIVCAVDASSSMERLIDAAAALSLSLIETAWRQKRSLALLFFNAQIVAEFRFPPGKKDLNAFLNAASVGCSGGTDFVPPLSRAVEIIGEVGFSKADIIMITDGLCKIPDEFLRQIAVNKDIMGFRIWTALLGVYDADNALVDEVKSWSDRVWIVKSLEDAAGEIIEEVV